MEKPISHLLMPVLVVASDTGLYLMVINPGFEGSGIIFNILFYDNMILMLLFELKGCDINCITINYR